MGRRKGGLIAFALPFLFTPVVWALTFAESFTTDARKHDSQLVWNMGLGELHPPLKVQGWDDGNGATDTDFDIGDGRHGVFNVSTYTRFSVNGTVAGGVIVINTDIYSDLHFTSFHLASGYRIVPVGSEPLVIRSQSDIIIEGEIDCSGGDGEDASTVISESRRGGVARCGGGAGGNSVPAGVAPGVDHQGRSGGLGVTGGAGGPLGNPDGGQGGGGGGAFIRTGGSKPDPTDGENPSGGSGGAAGNLNRDDAFVTDIDGGGSGGGGGSAFDDVGDPANHGSGAGGGAGGGNIRLYAGRNVTVTATGAIRANGGKGGDAGKGGAGGGGGGGSILIFAGGDIVLDGPVTAAAGEGGLSLLGGDGGTGAWGRTWIVEKDGFAAGGVIEDPVSELNVPGDVRFATGTFVAESVAIDFLNTQPKLLGSDMTVVNPGSGTVNFEMADSAETALNSFTNWADPTTLVGETFQRYFRFRLTVTNTDAAAPIRIQDISLEYEGRLETEFDFEGACGRLAPLVLGGESGAGPGPTSNAGWISLLSLLLPSLIWLGLYANAVLTSVPNRGISSKIPVFKFKT